MEYDRALYRVYERAVKDLAATEPIHPPRNQNPASSVRRRLVPHHSVNAATSTDQESQDHQPQNGSSTSAAATTTKATNANVNANAIDALDWSLPIYHMMKHDKNTKFTICSYTFHPSWMV
jgi:hypothetical protein